MPASDQGVQVDRYQLIPRTLIFLTYNDQVLLLRGAPDKRIWANLYNGLGGHVEQNEDILNAARRELYEESGLHFSDLWLVGVINVDTGQNPGIAVFVFRGDLSAAEGEVVTGLKSPEGELEWVPVSEIKGLPLVEDLPRLIPKVLSTTREAAPFIARYSYDDQGKLIIEFIN